MVTLMARFLVCLAAALFLAPAGWTQSLFDRAVRELSAGEYAPAEQDLLQVLACSPQHPGALENLGLICSKTGRIDQAIDYYRRAAALRPDDATLLLNLGVAYLKRESYQEALPVLQKLLDSTPGAAVAEDAELLHLLVAGYLKQNPTAEGRRAAGRLLNSVPPAPASAVLCRLYFEGGRFEDAEAQCRRTLAVDKGFPHANRELGKVLVSLHSAQAEQELSSAILREPSDAEAIYYYGVALAQDGKMTEASAQFERALSLDGNFWGSYFYLGKIKLQLRETAKALPLLRKAAALNPGAATVLYELGRALMAAGRTEEAAQTMERVRALRAVELQRDIQALGK
jgi:tetratricopeptide (TPR) repeat protein